MKVTCLIAAIGIAFVVVTCFGFDRQSTVAISDLTNACAALIAAAFAFTAVRIALLESHAETGNEQLARLKKTAPRVWAMRVGLFAVVCSLIGGLTTRYLLSVAIPYSPGNSEFHAGTVLKLYPVQGRGKRCDIYGIVRLEQNRTERFCYVGGLLAKHRIADAEVHIGDSVVVTFRRTPFGTAIMSIVPVS